MAYLSRTAVVVAIVMAIMVSRASVRISAPVMGIHPSVAVVEIIRLFETGNQRGFIFDKSLDELVGWITAEVSKIIKTTSPSTWSTAELVRFDRMCTDLLPVLSAGVDTGILTDKTLLSILSELACLYTNSTMPARVILWHMANVTMEDKHLRQMYATQRAIPFEAAVEDSVVRLLSPWTQHAHIGA